MSSPKKKIKKTVKTRPAAAAKTGKTRSAARNVAKPPRKSEAGTTAKAAKAVKPAADDVRKAAFKTGEYIVYPAHGVGHDHRPSRSRKLPASPSSFS
jgi:hypothetical protein